jgi:CubicO group peptidase (beta-lactamase class C family)
MPRTLSLPCLCLLLLAASGPVPRPALARERAVDFAELERVALAELKEKNTPGAAIAVISGDRVVFAKGLGVSNVETGAPVSPEMLFRLGSTTKMFTGAALARLDAEGKIDLDAPIGTYVKNLAPQVARVTAGQLLSHTAGVGDFAAPFVSNDDASLANAMRAFKDDIFFTEPGKIYSYSSPGYWLAGFVLEQVTGKFYADAMDELLFKPLGMPRTTLRPLTAMTHSLSVGHSVVDGSAPTVVRPAANNTVQWPAGSIYSSADDLARFAIAFLNHGRVDGKQALPAPVVAELVAPRATIPGPFGGKYGLGLISYEKRGVRVAQHGGFSRGYGSMITLVPEHRFAVIVVTNTSGETLQKTTEKAMELLLPLEPKEDEKIEPALPMTAAEMARYAGTYAQGSIVYEIVEKNGTLLLKQTDSELPLAKVGEYRFSTGPASGEIVLVRDAQGRVEFLFDGLYSARKTEPGTRPAR